MAAAIIVRSDCPSAELRGFARRCSDGDQVGGFWRWRLDPGRREPERSGEDGRRDPADRARLGAVVQRRRVRRLGDTQGTGAELHPERCPARPTCRNCRDRSNPGGTWRGALAAVRSGPMGMGRVPSIGHTPHPRARASRDGLPQALGTAPPSRPEAGRHCHF